MKCCVYTFTAPVLEVTEAAGETFPAASLAVTVKV